MSIQHSLPTLAYFPSSSHGWSPRCVRQQLLRPLVQLRTLVETLRRLGPGFHPHLPGFKHQFLAKALGATMWFFIFYRARCVTLECMLITPDDLPFVDRQDGAKLLVRPIPFLCTSLAHLCSVGIKPPMGVSWTRPPRRTWSHTPLDLFFCICAPSNKTSYQIH